MAPSMKMTVLVAAALLLLASSEHAARGWAMATTTTEAEDMVPVVSPAKNVMMVAMAPGGGVGTTLAAAPMCLQCQCCSKSDPSQCVTDRCCSSFDCDPAGKCNLVQQKCGCDGCGGGGAN